jgi:hypothetical protein
MMGQLREDPPFHDFAVEALYQCGEQLWGRMGAHATISCSYHAIDRLPHMVSIGGGIPEVIQNVVPRLKLWVVQGC